VQVRAYVINLKNRVDRWESVLQQSEKLGLPITRIEAVGKGDLEEKDEVFVVSGVAATWKSHQLAMATFLESSDKYGLIMEDDFLLTRSWSASRVSRVIELVPDLFQFGFEIDLVRRVEHPVQTLDWLFSLRKFEVRDLCMKSTFHKANVLLSNTAIYATKVALPRATNCEFRHLTHGDKTIFFPHSVDNIMPD
jgi:hypothetical protein